MRNRLVKRWMFLACVLLVVGLLLYRETVSVKQAIGMALAAIGLIVFNVRGLYESMSEAIRHVAFQVGSVITTTGFSTVDFDQWPAFSKAVLISCLSNCSGYCSVSSKSSS